MWSRSKNYEDKNQSMIDNSKQYEENILKKAGFIPGKDIQIQDIEIKYEVKDQTKTEVNQTKSLSYSIHTLITGQNYKEKLVFIHGFGASSILFQNILKQLSEKYKVYCIDIAGMGLSSRVNPNLTDPEEIKDFFVGSIENWRKKMNITNFTLIGHSFGGYLSGQYSLQYQEHLKRIILLSPCGVNQGQIYNKEQLEEKIEKMKKQRNFFQRMFFNQARSAINNRETPATMYQKKYLPTRFLLKKYIKNRMNIQDNDVENWTSLWDNMFMMESTTDKYFHDLFVFPNIQAKFPLEDSFKEKLQIPVYFMFGDKDWMNSEGAKRLIFNKQVKGDYYLVKNCGHQMNSDNPSDVLNNILTIVQ